MANSCFRSRSQATLGALALLTILSSSCTIYIGEDGMRMRSWASGGSGIFDDGPLHEGNGVAASEERAHSAISSVSIRGGFELNVRVGDVQSVVVHADSNLLEHIQTSVEEGELLVRMDTGSYKSSEALRVELVLPELRAVEVAGSVKGSLRGLTGDQFLVDVSGAATLDVDGSVDRLKVDIRGSANLDLFELAVREADIKISGSGKVRTHASERIEGRISGSGTILYRGHPTTVLSVSGSGTIQSVD